MDNGVHIGLAAWLHHRCDGDGFLAWPGAPVAMRLARLEGAESAQDMARVAEFSRLVNFVARRGQQAQPFSRPALWSVHADLLGRMDFAQRAWTNAENAAFLAARTTLYGPDGMTPLYLLYQEFRRAHQDLLAVAASADVLREAMVGWELEGGKSEIETALATVQRLTSRSTLSAAQAEQTGLFMLPVDPSGADYAMTGFAPISALDTSGWIAAKVSLSDIDGAVARAPQTERRPWTNWRRGKSGALTFRFAVLLVDRDWFTPDLYGADDWTLSEDAVVSDGGQHGLLPAYPARVYMVRDVTLDSPPAKPPRPQRQTPHASKPSLARPLTHARRAKLSVLPLRASPLTLTTSKGLGGVVPSKRSPVQPRLAAAVQPRLTFAPSTGPTLAVGLTLSAKPVMRLEPGTIQLVSRLTIQSRLTVARQIVARTPPSRPPDPTLWAVGFGCETLPIAPNPHPGYGWN